VANTILAVLWFGTTLAGFRAIRQRRYADHRRWMLRSVALSFSIVANRVWVVILFAVFVPELHRCRGRPGRDGPGRRRLHLDQLGGQPADRPVVARPAPPTLGG
jgi:hypothetical protein